MNVRVPVYIEQEKKPGSKEPAFTARPLLFEGPRRTGAVLRRVLAKLADDLRIYFDALGRRDRHDELARCTFCPEIESRTIKLKVNLRRRTAEFRALLVSFSALDRTLAFSPSAPDVWFEVLDGQDLEARAAEVYTRHFLDLEKEEDDLGADPVAGRLKGRALVTSIDLDVHPARSTAKREARPMAALGVFEAMAGADELFRTGRCLDRLYPDELDRVVLRDRELAELTRLLTAPDRRPVVLVGPPKVGKTALVHEFVYRRVHARKRPFSGKENVWLLSPQRLVSGMSYVGQWENRLLAIIKEARRQRHVLYFDDLPGLYQAGMSASSDLSMAQVLRPYVERREFRLLAEMTPEMLRVLRERDRGFADLFHVLPVAEPTEGETLRMLLTVMRGLEARRRCRFGLDALPAAIDLMRRYGRDSAFPGKAAAFLGRLAVKFVNGDVTRAAVLDEFRAKSGLSASFLDRRAKLDRSEVTAALSREVIGQPAAVEAMADVVCVAKARLNDPARPLAAFLFLGPTGVGKTQSAKALAAYLFGDAGRLVRLDMNEFVSPDAAARLVGTFDEPEGLLTAAIRRQPFSVVLLDEIEKAHPDVFDMLLSVLGEGRLTDALGRTADFGNAIIILTSNLGVREASAPLGFRNPKASAAGKALPPEPDNGAVYVAAAERFFRPEFVNRLDRLVPFARLGKEHIEGIARRLIADVLGRDGLVQRKCVLQIDPGAMERVVRQGFHPELGARALKRTIERQLTAPVAARLAAITPGTPTVISLYPAGERIVVQTQGLPPVRSAPPPAAAVNLGDPDDVLDRVDAAVARIHDELDGVLPEGRVSLSDVRPEHHRYFAVREQSARVRRMLGAVEDRLADKPVALPPRGRTPITRGRLKRSRMLRRIGELPPPSAERDVMDVLAERAAEAEGYGESLADRLTDLILETALLDVMARPAANGDRAMMHIRAISDDRAVEHNVLAGLYLELFEEQWGLSASAVEVPGGDKLLLIEGPAAAAIAGTEAGTHLFYPARGHIVPVQVRASPLPEGADPAATLAAQAAARRKWLDEMAAGGADPEADPFRLAEVIRLYDDRKITADLRSGLAATKLPGVEELRTFILSALPLPPELVEPAG